MSEPPIVPLQAASRKHPCGAPNPVDVHVGKRVRLRRMMLGLSQEDLATALGVAFQQIQKYECAINRLSVPRLWDLGRILRCPVAYFFEGLEGQSDAAGPQGLQTAPGTTVVAGESIRLVRAYAAIGSADTRRQILDLASSLGPRRAEDADGP
jgi:transcriptional regulator with XRE-family HTH domain